MSHLCAIPDCERPAKDGQLMCWPHWRRVPRALNHAVFDTYRNLRQDPQAYRQARDAAINAVVAKEQAYVSTGKLGDFLDEGFEMSPVEDWAKPGDKLEYDL